MPWTPPTTRTTGELITASIWNTDLKDNLLVLKTSIDNGGNLSVPAATTLTLASDACTPTQNFHKIDSEGAAATDNLSTLTVSGNIRSGHLLVLHAANASHVITVKNGTGNILLYNGDYLLYDGGTGQSLVLMYDASLALWVELSRSSFRSSIIATTELRGYSETAQTGTISANNLTMNYSSGNHWVVSLNANITSITATNMPGSNKVASLMVWYLADGTARTITHTINSVAVRWPSGTAPTMTSTSGKVDKILYTTFDNGTNWFGEVVGQNF